MRKSILNNDNKINIGGFEFTITGVAGEGSSCVVYNALRTIDKISTKWLIKEFYPAGYEFSRDSNNMINYSNDVKVELDRFSKTVEIMSNIYNELDRNDTSPEDSCSCEYKGYLVIPQLEGKTLKEYNPNGDLKALFTRIWLVAKKLERYHKGNYLILDIKPENIFCCDGDFPRVQIIDFDSAIKADAQDDNVIIRCSSDWAAPELITGKRDQICAAADTYAVGEMLYNKLTGEHSDILEHTMHGNHDLSNSELLKGVNPTLLKKLAEFFRKTLCSAPSARYSDEEFVKALDELIKLSAAPYIISDEWWQGVSENFFGRDEELKTVHEMLADKKYLFIQGFGGIGKSDFAKKFAAVYHSEYDISLRTRSKDPIDEIQLGNYNDPGDDVSDEKKRILKRDAIEKACSEKNVLMIFDSSDKIDDSIICNELLTLPGNKVFLTRKTNWRERGQKCFELDALSMEDALKLFKNFCTIDDSESEEAARQIIEEFHRHTLAVKLAAKAISKRRLGCKGDIARFVGKIQESKAKIINDDDPEERTFLGHIKVLFDVFELDKDTERPVLACLSLLPESGISRTYLYEDAEFDLEINIDVVDHLIGCGWIQESGDYNEIISLHPLIAEVAQEQLCNYLPNCCAFLKGLCNYAENVSGDGIARVISGVAENLIGKLSADSLESKEFFLAAADFLKRSCGIYGSRSSQVKRLEKAIICYIKAGNTGEKVIEAASKLAEICRDHYYEKVIDDGFLKCLDILYETLPHTEENQPLFEDFFRLALIHFDEDGKEAKAEEMLEKLESCLREAGTDEADIKICVCDICAASTTGFEIQMKYYERAIEYFQQNGIQDERYDELCEIRDFMRSRRESGVENFMVYNESELEPKLENKSIKEQIEIAKQETNVFEKACMFIHIASAPSLSYSNAVECLEEAKKALESDVSSDHKIIEFIDQGIMGLRDHTKNILEICGTLINWNYYPGPDSLAKLGFHDITCPSISPFKSIGESHV